MDQRSNITNSKNSKKQKKEETKKKRQAYNEKAANEKVYETISDIKSTAWNNSLIIGLIVLVMLSLYLQYKHEMTQRMSRGTDEDNETDHHEILGVSHGASLPEIRKQYKEMTKLWHPDKNPDCKACQEKFLKISKAYEVLLEETEKGGKSIFSSNPYHLNARNYHQLVEESNDFWVILIYENTRGNGYNKHVAGIWDEMTEKHGAIVKFGVIDVLTNENLLHFLPYKFQFYPNIITYLHGETSELFQNIESFSVNTFSSFIEESFISKVQIINDRTLNYQIQSAIENKSPEVKKTSIQYSDINIKLYILSPKSNVDIVTKDFAKKYDHSVQIYQNDMGTFDKFLKSFKSNGEYKVYIQYNDIIGSSEDNVTFKNVIKPLPVLFKPRWRFPDRLAVAFNLAKSLTMQQLYKNNYHKHCSRKRRGDASDNETTKINMCMVLLDHTNMLNDNKMDATFYKNLMTNFEKRMKRVELLGNGNAKQQQQNENSEEYEIIVNYANTQLEKNKRLFKLYNDYMLEKNIQVPSNKSMLFFIVNDTQEKFTFKFFKDEEVLSEFLEDFDKSDFFEDYSFSVSGGLLILILILRLIFIDIY